MNPEFRADLHCHSFFSDGSDSPMDLLKKAKQARLSGLSVTDHDTIKAYTPEFFACAKALDICVLTGVEFSSELFETTVHILGYGFDLNSPSLIGFIEEMQRRRKERNRAILDKLKKYQILLDEEELLLSTGSETSVGRPHIANLMLKKGYVNSFQEAFDRYLKESASCYVPGFKFAPSDAIQIIHEAKGKAVLAHPHFMKNASHIGFLLSLPFDGIECYYGNFSNHQEMRWVKIAKQKGWIATGGSDYHGVFKPHIQLGCSWVGLSTFQQLLPDG